MTPKTFLLAVAVIGCQIATATELLKIESPKGVELSVCRFRATKH